MSATPTSAKKQISTDVNFSPERSYPGKGVGYDWQAVLAEVEAAHLDRELLSFEVVPSE